MSARRESHLYRHITWLIGITAVVVIAALVGYRIIIASPSESWKVSAKTLFDDLVPEFIAALAAVAIGVFALKNIERSRREYETEQLAQELSANLTPMLTTELSRTVPAGITYYEQIDAIPWSDLIRGSTRVDVCVHFWPGWVSRNSDAFKSLFASGGSVRLVLPNKENAAMISVLKERLPDYTENKIRDAIQETKDNLESIFKSSATGAARLETYFIDHMMWYCGMRFDQRTLALSLYEHKRHLRITSPTILIELESFQETRAWFEKEFQDFIERAIPTPL